MHNFLKPFLFCFAAAFSLSSGVLAGANNQAPKVESENNSSVATELNKLKESSALSQRNGRELDAHLLPMQDPQVRKVLLLKRNRGKC